MTAMPIGRIYCHWSSPPGEMHMGRREEWGVAFIVKAYEGTGEETL